MLAETDPFDHTIPVAAEEVKVTLPPEQNVVGPIAVTVGTGGIGVTVTSVEADVAEVQPSKVTDTVYEPAADDVMLEEVSFVDQIFPVGAEDVNTTLPPAQKLSGPLAVMVGAGGIGLEETTTGTDVCETHPEGFVYVTV